MTKLLTLKQIHEASGIAMQTLYAMVEREDLACVRTTAGPGAKQRTRGAIRVLEADWDAWVQRHRTPAKGEGDLKAPSKPAAAARRPTVLQLRGADRYTG